MLKRTELLATLRAGLRVAPAVALLGPRQCGKTTESPRAHLFLIDYASRRRLKIWGAAQVIDHDPARSERLTTKAYKARASQVILFKIDAWDANCPQHIPQRFEAADVAAMIADRDQRIATLEAQALRLRAVTMRMVVVATSCRAINRRIANLCEARGLPGNVVDDWRVAGVYGIATLNAALKRAAKASRFLSRVHSKMSGVRRADASSEISTAPHPKS